MASNNESKATVKSTSNQPKVVISDKERNIANEKTSIPPNRISNTKSKKKRSQKNKFKRKQSRKMRKSVAQKMANDKTSNDGEEIQRIPVSENIFFRVACGCGIIAIILVIVYYVFYL